MRKVSLVLPLIFLTVVAGAAAQNRTALLVANGNYANYGKLANPVPEARALKAALERLGFQVTLVENASREAMVDALADFEGALTIRGGIAFFHYGGHGVQVGGKNYLIPSNADIPDEKRVASRCVDLDEVMAALDSGGSETNIVVLDACRNNPLPASAGRSASRGLAVVGTKPRNSIIVYAAESGNVAIDGLFTPALTRALGAPGLDLGQVVMQVRREVFEASKGAQTPGEYNQLFAPVYLAGAAPTKPAAPSAASVANAQPPQAAAPTMVIQKSYGSITVSAATAGTLFLDGTRMGELPASSKASLGNIETGERSLELRYADGQSERLTATVSEGQATNVAFAYRKAAPQAAPAAPVAPAATLAVPPASGYKPSSPGSGSAEASATAWKSMFWTQSNPFLVEAKAIPGSAAYREQWRSDPLGEAWPCLLTGDCTGDKKLEIVASVAGKAYIFSHDGRLLSTFALSGQDVQIQLLADVDEDGKDELLSGGGKGSTTIVAYDPDGSIVARYQGPKPGDSYIYPVAVVGGKLFAKVSTGYSGQPRGALRFDVRSGAQDWFYSIGPAAAYSAALLDEGRGSGPILAIGNSTVHNGVTGDGNRGGGPVSKDGDLWIVLINQDGKPHLVSQPRVGAGDGVILPFFYDYGKDGKTDLIASIEHTRSYPGTDLMSAIDIDTGAVLKSVSIGTTQWYWTPVFDRDRIYVIMPTSHVIKVFDQSLNLLKQQDGISFNAPCFVADIDGDAVKEIAVSDGRDLLVIDSKSLGIKQRIPFGAKLQQCIVGDLDGDGDLEIVAFDGSLSVRRRE